jgi:hypothetical protein
MTDDEIIAAWQQEWRKSICNGGNGAVVMFGRAIIAAERERWRNKLTEQAKHMRANAEALRQWPEQAEESRARELAATYVQELVWCDRSLSDQENRE